MKIKQILFFNITIKNTEEILYDYPLKISF